MSLLSQLVSSENKQIFAIDEINIFGTSVNSIGVYYT